MKLLILILGITIAHCVGDSHIDVIDAHSEDDPFHQLLHAALKEEGERGYFNNDEIGNVLNVSKNRFPEHQCVSKLSLDVTNDVEWREDEITLLARRIIFAIMSDDDCPAYSDVNHGNICQADMVKILHDFRSSYEQEEDNDQCFNAFTMSGGGCVDSDEVNLILFRHIYLGNCLYPTQDDVIEDLKEHLNVTEDGILYKTEFEKLLSSLNIAEKAEEESHDDHGHEEEHDDHEEEHDDHGHEEEHDDHDEEHGDHDEEHGDHEDEHGDHEEEHDDHGHEEEHGDHEEEHDDHEVEHNDHEEEHGDHEEEHGDHEEEHDDHEEHSRRRRAADEHHEHVSTCLKAQGFYDIFQVKENISWAQFVEMSPVILQQVFTGACKAEDHHDENTNTGSYTSAQKYGYGTLAVLLISLLALVGLMVIPLMGKLAYDGVMQFFVALGISSLFTDAVVHILPFVLGIHVHGAADEHDHEEEENNDYIWKLSVVAAGVYFFFLLECLLRKWHAWRIVANIDHANDMGKDHKHDTQLPGPTIGGHAHVYGSRASVPDQSYIPTEDIEKAGKGDQDVIPYLGITPVCLMIFIGDVLHNFGDGLAIGVSFSASISAGIGTSLAVFCHELPHEFGDFAIYLSNGASKKKAILLNVVAALCALIGLYIGIAVASDIAIRQWLLAIIAGMFLYISLVDVLHEVIEAVPRRSMGIFFVQNLGMLLGWTALMLLALYEEDLSNAVSN